MSKNSVSVGEAVMRIMATLLRENPKLSRLEAEDYSGRIVSLNLQHRPKEAWAVLDEALGRTKERFPAGSLYNVLEEK